ncbi:PTS system mannose/fructose/sorbose family transporter subunit IID [Oceanobacillus sojae]|uniref:PTS system mannose/fructose/sorbose family transporter subunit IID n=1 Tax=Oceanobacillus sojae TaxID=582851 RepID=UPI0021A4840C|nr:PTS system mannose/fructose/sorbose family transporter subunit IID [Oceanobacillus sojae]MCT1902037.1 PTS system mannose/fructose/sorbose family transporter subunit IID [Oceanobacillus sojae]
MTDPSSQEITRKDLLKVFWRSLRLLGSFNFERMQALGYVHTMIPIIKKLYKTKEDTVAALKRHLLFFNTAPWLATFIFGITIAMEEQNAKNKDFDSNSIESTKISLMGPLAAIGDSFWWGTFRLLAAGIGTSLTVEGNPLGLLLYVLVFNVPHYLARYYGLFIGYKVGASFLNKAMESGIMQKITYGASIVGLMSVGAMTATMVKFETPLEFNFGDASIKVQEVLDQIFPAILPLAVTFFVYYLLKKEVKIMYVILGLLAFGIVASLIGLM